MTRRDGRPHVTPVWFVLDGDDVISEAEQELMEEAGMRLVELAYELLDDTPPAD